MSVSAPSDTIFVQNMRPGPAVHTHGDITIKWGGAGDPSGEDIQGVPAVVANSSQFLRAVSRGIFKKISMEEAEAAIDLQTATYMHEAQQADAAAVAVLDSADDDNVLVPMKCLVSGADVMVQQAYVDVIPPLAPNFAHLAAEFVPTLGADGTTQWARIPQPPKGGTTHG
jgi:hypothetical protein